MQTLTISRTGGRSNYTLSPTRNTGELQDKLAKCNGKSRKSAIRDTRTKGEFPKFEAGMSTADYVRLFESCGTPCKPVEWAQLNSEPCTLYSGADTCETLPNGFETWEDFDAAQSADAAPESTLAAANDDAAPTVPDPEPAAHGEDVAAPVCAPADDEPAETGAAWFERIIAENKAKRDDCEARAQKVAPLDSVPFKHSDGERFGVAGPCMSEPGRFRFSYFDPRGAIGHCTRDTLALAMWEALDLGYLYATEDTAPASPPTTHSSAAPIRCANNDAAPAWSAAVNGAVRRGLDRTPIQYLPNYARMAIERADADSGLRSTAKVSELVRAYAATHGAIAEEWEIASALYICGRRFWDFDAAPDGAPVAAPVDPLPTQSDSVPVPGKLDAAPERIEPDIFIRRATSAERMGNAPRQRAMRSLVPMAGHTVMFKPYGHKGAGFYWVLDRRADPLPSESDNAAPIECEPVPDVAAEVAAPIADPVSCADDVAELTARLLAAVARPKIAPMPAEPAPVPGKSEPETVMLSHVLGALQCIAPDGIPDAAMLAREADRIEATAERMRDAMPDYSATCATVARDLRAMADSAIDPLPGKSEPDADPFDAWQAAPNDPKPTFGAYSYAKRTGRTVIAYCGDGRIQSCAKAAGMRYVHRVKGFVGTPRQAEKMRAAWLADAMRNAERAKDGVAEPGSLRAMLESLAVPTNTPLPGKSEPEAPEDDETIPAPLDGLDVEELGDDGPAEFERATRGRATAPAYRELTTAHYRPQGPCLRIPAFDARAMIPPRFAPVYLLQS